MLTWPIQLNQCRHDWYDSYPSTAVTDPEGPSSGSHRVLRGGTWTSYAHGCRSASRNTIDPGDWYSRVGFRLVRQDLWCNYSLSSVSKTFTSSGGSSSVTVSAPTGCAWSALSNESWITITSGSIGRGNGTVDYWVSSHTKNSSRTGTMTIGGQTFTVTQDGMPNLDMTFVLIPAGTFIMGSPPDEPGRDKNGNEKQHQVTLSQSFYMQTTEVTQAQWEAVMGSNPSEFSGCPNCPVEQVHWDDVREFIYLMNERGEGTYSLPTEAQWEYACRAGSTSAFANGAILETGDGYDPHLDAMGWYAYNSDDKTHPVAQKTPNAWGLYDMHGNVGEWCRDWYGNYPSDPVTDPLGPNTGKYRIFRGGAWAFPVKSCRSAERGYASSDTRSGMLGLRLVLKP